MDTSAHPYTELTPDRVLNAVETVGVACDGRLQALNSYENRVYQVGIEGGAPLVVKFYRPARWSDAAILDEHAFSAALAEREIPIVAPLSFNGKTLHEHQGFRFALFPRKGGRAPELEDPDVLEWLGRFLGRIHALGAIEPFLHRPALNVETFGDAPREYLIDSGLIPDSLRAAYDSVTAQALDAVRACYARAGDVRVLRLHGDCHAGNILWTDAGPHFVDFDDARMGPAMQDVWMLLSGDRAQMTRQLRDILAGYGDFFEFNLRELHLIEALRTLRLVHFSAWLARRWDDPAFPPAFPWFNSARYWEEQILSLREQIALMQEAPLHLSPL